MEQGSREGETPVRPPCVAFALESSCLGLQLKEGGKFHRRLNIGGRPIAYKYREGKMQRTLKRELKSTFTLVKELSGWWWWWCNTVVVVGNGNIWSRIECLACTACFGTGVEMFPGTCTPRLILIVAILVVTNRCAFHPKPCLVLLSLLLLLGT